MVSTKKPQGLTLAEVILAISLLAVLVVTVLGFFTALLSSSTKSNDQAAGIMFADQLLEQAAAAASRDYPAFPATRTGSRMLYSNDQELTTFTYTVTATEMTPDTNPLPTSPGQSWMLEAEVRWWRTDQNAARTGYGNLFTRMARVVYVSR